VAYSKIVVAIRKSKRIVPEGFKMCGTVASVGIGESATTVELVG